jgi:hypothetical protein
MELKRCVHGVSELNQYFECFLHNWCATVMTEHNANIAKPYQEEIIRIRNAFHEFVETVDDALLLDEYLAEAWHDLEKGVVKARKVLDGTVKTEVTGSYGTIKIKVP